LGFADHGISVVAENSAHAHELAAGSQWAEGIQNPAGIVEHCDHLGNTHLWLRDANGTKITVRNSGLCLSHGDGIAAIRTVMRRYESASKAPR
jgi:hypothetical protein